MDESVGIDELVVVCTKWHYLTMSPNNAPSWPNSLTLLAKESALAMSHDDEGNCRRASSESSLTSTMSRDAEEATAAESAEMATSG